VLSNQIAEGFKFCSLIGSRGCKRKLQELGQALYQHASDRRCGTEWGWLGINWRTRSHWRGVLIKLGTGKWEMGNEKRGNEEIRNEEMKKW